MEVLIGHFSPLPTRFYTGRYAVALCRGAAAGLPGSRVPRLHRDGCDVLLMQSGEVNSGARACGCADFQMLFIEPALVVAAGRELGFSCAPRFRTTLSGNDAFRAAVIGFCAAVEQRASAVEQQSRLAACIPRMLDLMVEPHPPARDVSHSVARARDHLRQRFHETVTLDELAGVARLSRYHLLRSFSAHVGLPPHAYQMRLRIERAMALLRSGLPASTVAALTGFADQSHMTRHFRRLLRVTPADYARAADGR